MSQSFNPQNYATFFPKRCIMICHHTSCLKAGAARVFDAFAQEDLPEDVVLQKSECQGQCSTSPTVRIVPEETWYYRVKPSDVPLIVQQHLKGGLLVKDKLNPRIHFSWQSFQYPPS
jgi:(2Fe-2S) ferredoxin